jgi:beta-lactamase family protein
MALEDGLLAAVRAVGFDAVLDSGPDEARRSAPVPVARPPHVDLAVIDLDAHGHPRAAANVLLSPGYQAGVAVPLDDDLAATSVRFRRWGMPGDVVRGREGARLEFTAPYPASLFKLVVAFHVLALADRGVIDLDARYAYEPVAGADEEPVTGGGPAVPGTQTNREWLDAMVCASNDRATCALLKQLHGLGEIDAMNAGMRALGLDTLQVNGTSPHHGGRWRPGDIHMTAMDTARLLCRIARGAGGATLYDLLADQGCNEALSTANWGLGDYPEPGIPQRVPERWIDPIDGSVTVDGKAFGRDVRPANAGAQVTFAHKTGLTYNFGSDAGIVRSLPGAPQRHYVIALIANLGHRYGDGREPSVRYTQKIAQLGRRVDELLTAG